MLRALLQGSGLVLGTLLLAPVLTAQFFVSGDHDLSAIGEALDVGEFTIQSIDVPADHGASVSLDVQLGDGVYTLAMQPWSIRSTEHFEVLVQGADGEYTPFDAGPSQIWHGVALGVPGSRVSASLVGGQLDALVRLNDEEPIWAVQPLTDVDDSASRLEHVVYNSAAGIDRGQTCGGALVVNGNPAPPSGGYAGSANDKVCQIACDADMEFYNKNGSSVANTEADIELIIDRVQTIYQNDVDIVYEITTIIVRTAEPDPYSSTSAGTLLNQFQSHWNSSQGGVVRDVAHLFTGKNINGGTIGIAYLNVICNLGSAYGLSESKFSGSLTSRTGLTAHELGHNWSAPHCDGAGDCWIMCSGLGGCQNNLTKFGSNSTNSITNKKNSVGCLSNAVPPLPPVVSSVSPGSIGALGGLVTINGSGLDEATSATIDGISVSVSNVSENSVTVTAPASNTLGNVPVTVTNEGGTSNSVTLSYTTVTTPALVGPTIVNTAFDTLATWTMAGQPSDTCLILFDFDPVKFNYQGFNVLLTDFAPLTIPLNSAGVGTLPVVIDPSMGGMGFYNVYVQAVFLGPPFYFATPTVITLFI
jgi:hypothetical protein